MTRQSIFAVVLAAGASSRFGSTKQLAVINGRAMVRNAASAAETVCGAHSVIVIGNDWENVAAAVRPFPGFLALNPDFGDGLSSSIRRGVACIADVADAVLLMLADQPRVDVAHLQILIDAWREHPDHIVASRYAGGCGPPVIFPRAFFAKLQSLGGDQGARPVIEANRHRLIAIDCPDAALDIDRPEDLQRL